MLETNCSDVENKLNDLIKRLLIAFCEINVTFNTRLDIYGSVHVLSDNLEISSILLNEHSFKKNGIRTDKSADNLLEEAATTRMKKRVKQSASTRLETLDEEELLIEKEWNDPLPSTIVPDAPSTSSTTIRKFNYSNQLLSSKANSRSGRKCRMMNDDSVNPLLTLFRNEMAGSESPGFLSKFAQGKSTEENGQMQPLNASLSTLLEGPMKMDLKTEGFANFNSQSIFPEPELICMDGQTVKSDSPDAICKSLLRKNFSEGEMRIESSKERDFMHIKTESEPLETEGVHQVSNHAAKHPSDGLASDLPAGDPCFAQIPDFMMNFLAASKLLRLNALTSDGPESSDHLFKCLICSSTFSNSLLLQDHFKSHYDGTRHVSSNGNLPVLDAQDGPSGHLNSAGGSTDVVVPEANKLFCVICNLTFRSLDGLKCHINSKHSLQKTYKCRFCPKLFLTRQAAYSHRVKFHSLSVAKK